MKVKAKVIKHGYLELPFKLIAYYLNHRRISWTEAKFWMRITNAMLKDQA